MTSNARKHESFPSLEKALPLRGRWLRYAVAALLALLGSALFLLVAAAFFFPLYIGLLYPPRPTLRRFPPRPPTKLQQSRPHLYRVIVIPNLGFLFQRSLPGGPQALFTTLPCTSRRWLARITVPVVPHVNQSTARRRPWRSALRLYLALVLLLPLLLVSATWDSNLTLSVAGWTVSCGRWQFPVKEWYVSHFYGGGLFLTIPGVPRSKAVFRIIWQRG